MKIVVAVWSAKYQTLNAFTWFKTVREAVRFMHRTARIAARDNDTCHMVLKKDHVTLLTAGVNNGL